MSLIRRLLRGAVRDRLLTAINITGMAIGLAVGFLILAFALQEYDHDARWPEADRMYRVDAWSEDDGQRTHWADTPYRLADDLRESGAGIDAASVFLPEFSVVRAGSVLEYNRIWYVHPSFLDLFDVDVLAGNVEQALRSPESVVLTASEARRYVPFGSPIGELIEINIGGAFESFRVDAVVADSPAWSSLQWGILLPYETARAQPGKARQHDAGHGQAATFVRLADGVQAADVRLPEHERLSFFLTPVEDMYFLSEASTLGIVRTGDKQRADVLIGLALLIILIACSNFTTISLARSVQQNRAVGIRKVVGASRLNIAAEYLGDALLKTSIAALVGIGLADLLSTAFGTLMGQTVDLSVLTRLEFGVLVALGVILVGVLAGSIPTWHLARVQPVDALKGASDGRGRSRLIQSVVVLQFVATAVLLASAWIMSHQLAFLNRIDLGLDAENVLVVEPDFTNGATIPALHAQLSASTDPAISGVALSNGMLSRSLRTMEIPDGDETRRIHTFGVSAEYVALLGLDVTEGTPIDASNPSHVLINRTLANELGGAPVGTMLTDAYRVGGIVEDFHFLSVTRAIGPMALLPLEQPESAGYLLVRHAAGREQDALSAVQDAWRLLAPDTPMSYYRLSDNLGDRASGSAAWARIVRYSTLFALLIATLGLFGLSALAAARRTKEIGIRKVLGAGSVRVAGLLVGESVRLLVVACVLAAPLVWWLMGDWLARFAVRDVPGAVSFLLLGALLVLVAVLTVGSHALRVALANPVDSLRRE
ncbi:MAG: ABC transporter permease [Rhodothermales bacterium]